MRHAALTGLVVAVLALVGCTEDEPVPGDGSGAPSAPGGSEAAGSAGPTEPAGALPDGCELVTAQEIEDVLGFDPGDSRRERSSVGGPPSCGYDAVSGFVQVAPDADFYFTGDAYDPGAVPDAVDAPAPAERGYVAVGGFLVVKGDAGVLFTAGDARDSTLEQWTELAAATAAKLP